MSTQFTGNAVCQYYHDRPPLKGLGRGGMANISPSKKEIDTSPPGMITTKPRSPNTSTWPRLTA
jgi:hypothetical protein